MIKVLVKIGADDKNNYNILLFLPSESFCCNCCFNYCLTFRLKVFVVN
jgi:hypothetical protein